jgi:hypothetical protein
LPKIIITHNVIDTERWLSFKAERAEAINSLGGGSQVVDHVAEDGSNAVAISVEVNNLETVLSAIESPPPQLGALMEKHGVIPPLAVYVET